MKKGGFMKDAVILCVITLIAGACLGGVYGITKEPIEIAQQKAKELACRQVLPSASEFETVLEGELLDKANAEISGWGFGKVSIVEYAVGKDTSGAVVGNVVSVMTMDGYGDAITASIGVQADGTVTGIEFLTISETAGLGDNAKKPEWRAQFTGKQVETFVVTKSGASADNEIDALSGATITSDAVTNAVNAAIHFSNSYLAQ